MRRLVKYLFIFMLVLCGILIAGLAFLGFADLNAYREPIANMATRVIGRPLELNGHIDINLFPRIEVVLNDVRLANAMWGTEPEMVRVGHADATIDFPGLLSDPIVIRRMRLNDVSVLLEQNRQRVGNWVMGAPKPPTDTERAESGRDIKKRVELPLMVDRVEFSNITVTLRSPEAADQVLHLASLRIQPDQSDNVILKSSGTVLGYPMVLDGEITSNATLKTHGAVNLDIKASLGGARLTGQAATNRLATLAGLQGKFHIVVDDIQKALKIGRIKAPLTGALTVDIDAVETDGTIDLTAKTQSAGITADVTAKLIDIALHEAHLKLRIDDVQKVLQTAQVDTPLSVPLTADVTVEIDDGDYKATAESRVAGITSAINGTVTGKQVVLAASLRPLDRAGELFDLKGIRADTLKVTAKADCSADNAIEIEELRAHIGDNRLAAQGRIDLAGESNVSLTLVSPDLTTLHDALPPMDLNAKATVHRSAEKIAMSDLNVTFDKSDIRGNVSMKIADKPKIAAEISSSLLDLRPFTQKHEPSTGTAETPPAAVTQAQDRYVFKEAPLHLAPFQNVEADIKLAVNTIQHDRGALKDAVVDAVVHNGDVDAQFKFAGTDHGYAAAKLDLKTQGQSATLDTVVSLSDVHLSVLAAEGIAHEEVPPISVSLQLQAAGASPRELASTANGRMLLTQGPGKVNNTVVRKFTSDIVDQLLNALNPFAQQETITFFDCTVVDVAMAEGRAEIATMLVQGEKMMIVGGGDIDLKTETLNVEFLTKPRTGVGITADMFVTPFIKLTGTLVKPSIGLNKKGTLLTGGAAIATGGLSLFLKGAFDRTTGAMDRCERTLEEAGPHINYNF